MKSATPPPLPSERSFGLLMSGVATLLALWLAWHNHAQGAVAAAVAAGLLAAVTALAPGWLRGANRLWFKLGLLLHRIVNPLVLGLMFFGLLTPIAWVMRLAGRDALTRRFDAQKSSYWVDRQPPGPPGESLKNPF